MGHERGHYKDEGLDELAASGNNVAQFVSYDNDGNQRFSRVLGQPANYQFDDQRQAVAYMLENNSEHRVNVRSYDPETPESRPFTMHHSTVDETLAVLSARRNEGLHTIINEDVNNMDGGVSGVVFGNMVEVVPFETPRGVEKGGTAQFTRDMGADVIGKVYGITPNLGDDRNQRREFTITTLRTGVYNQHTLVWEIRQAGGAPETAETRWPNKFSDMLGDKTFGLLIADQIGLQVPHTQVFNRQVAPFSFGQETGTRDYWMRTAPNAQTPGLYSTTHGWTDPFEIMKNEDPEGDKIASILSQEGVDAKYSGACIMGADGKLIINGSVGYGDDFMVGESKTSVIPNDICQAIEQNYQKASTALGDAVRFEWVYDGSQLWTVQFHRGESTSYGNTIYPGAENTAYVDFRTHDLDGHSRIDALREFISNHAPGTGITLVGDVGVTSHLGDLLRKAKIPSRLEFTKGE